MTVRTRRLFGCLLVSLWVLQGLVLLILTFRGQHVGWLSISLAATTSLLVLSGGPRFRPERPRPRRRAVVLTGRALLVLVWLAQAAVAGFVGFVVAGVPEDQVYDLRLVVTVLIGWTLARFRSAGRALAGFPPKARFGVRTVVRGVLALAATVAAAAFAHQREAAAAALRCWVPARGYDMFYGWWSTPFFAVPLSLPVWLLWGVVLTVAAVSVINLSKRIFGGDNEVAKWAEGLEVVKVEVNGERPGCLLSWYAWTGEPVTPWREAFLRRRYARPLSSADRWTRQDRIVRRLRAAAPAAGWRELRVAYRATGDHEELTGSLDTRPWSVPGDLLLEDLRRLREADYEPGYGTWTELTIWVPERSHGFHHPDRPPAWQRPPTRRELSADQRRFPVVRRIRRLRRARRVDTMQ